MGRQSCLPDTLHNGKGEQRTPQCTLQCGKRDAWSSAMVTLKLNHVLPLQRKEYVSMKTDSPPWGDGPILPCTLPMFSKAVFFFQAKCPVSSAVLFSFLPSFSLRALHLLSSKLEVFSLIQLSLKLGEFLIHSIKACS